MANNPVRNGLAATWVDDETHDQAGEVEAPVESVGECSEVVIRISGVAEVRVGTRQHCLEVAQHGVDPLELRQVPGLALADDLHELSELGVGHSGKAPQAIAAHIGTRRQFGAGPLGNRIAGEFSHRRHLDVQRIARVAERDRRAEGDLILRATARFTAGSLAAEVCVVHLHRARRAMLRLTLGHCRNEFVMHQPGGRVTHADVALESQSRQPGLRLADEVDRKNPLRQRQLGSAKQRACGQRGLTMACMAMKQRSTAADDNAVGSPGAARTAESIWPTSASHGLGAGGFGVKALEKFGQ